jgi:hypothetical protein
MIKKAKLIFLLSFFAILLQGVVLFYDKMDELLAIPLFLILGGATAYFLKREGDEESDFQVSVFLLAFSARVLVGMIFYGWGLYKAFGDEDSLGYMSGWTFALNWYNNGLDGFISDIIRVFVDKQNIGQSVIWGVPMFIAGGPSRLIVSVINSFAGALLVIVIYRIAKRVFDSNTARIAAILVAFWPSIVLLSAGTSKEMLVLLFDWILLYLIIRSPGGLSLKDGIAAIPAMLALYITRFYAIYMIGAGYAVRVVTSSKQHLIRNVVFGTIVLGSVLLLLGTSGVVNRDFEQLDQRQSMMETWRENVSQTTGSGINIYEEYGQSSVSIPLATVYFFLAPFPWEVLSGSLRSSFAAIENIAIFAILLMGFPALKIFFKDRFRELLPILVFCALYAGFHIWGLVNVGLAWRHKQTVMPMFFMLVALSITQRRKGWQIISQKLARKREPLGVVPIHTRR